MKPRIRPTVWPGLPWMCRAPDEDLIYTAWGNTPEQAYSNWLYRRGSI